MDFTWTDEQVALKNAATKFAKRELNSGLSERDQRGEFDLSNWKKCADFGVQGLSVPQQYGGSEQDLVSVVLALEGLGYGCKDNGLLFALGAQMWSVQIPLVVFGSEALKAAYLPRLVSGEIIGAHAVTEPDSGSDVFSLRTTATRKGRCYVLNGQKTFITNAPVADVFLVLATLDPSEGTAGLT